MHKPNNLLELDVQESLDWDMRLDDSRIVVAADDGRVTLTGSVPTYLETLRAADDAALVGGVKSIDNQLLVGLIGDAITDDSLTAAAVAALDADKFVPAGSVAVSVFEGFVTLTGQMRHHYQRQAARHAVSRIDGVLGVNDDITLTAAPIPSDVVDGIDRALRRNAILNGSHISVTNVGPTIFLDGTVGTATAKQLAEDTAWDAPGVRDVVDRLTVSW